MKVPTAAADLPKWPLERTNYTSNSLSQNLPGFAVNFPPCPKTSQLLHV